MKHFMSLLMIIVVSCVISPHCLKADTMELRDAQTFLHDYVSHLNGYLSDQNDLNALQASANDMSYPAVWTSPKGNKLIASSKTFVLNNTRNFIDYLRKQGIVKIEWGVMELKKLGPKVVIASNVANLLDKDGQLVSESSGTYLLHNEDGAWRIFSRIQHTPEDRINL